MANIDYQGAIAEIENIFSKREGKERKVIFWYDPAAGFKEDLLADNLSFCRLLVCEHNEFGIKRIIEVEDRESNILVYIPTARPQDSENWLLDTLLYGEEYYADTVALTMRSLGLTSIDLRRVIEKHRKFFESADRIKRLGKYINLTDQSRPEELVLAMMSVLVRAGNKGIENILTELVFDDENASRYGEIKKNGFEEDLWNGICEYCNYEGEQNIERLTKKFFYNAMIEQGAVLDDTPSFYKQFEIEEGKRMDAKAFVERINHDKRYEALQATIADELKIEGLLSSRDIKCYQKADVFECIDALIIKKIVDGLCKGSLDYDAFTKAIEKRIDSLWYSRHENEYGLLRAVIAFRQQTERPIPNDMTASEYIKGYVTEYYKVDAEYRHVCAHYKKIEYSTPEIELLVESVEIAYQEKFLVPLGREFSASLAREQKWDFIGVGSTKDFYHMVTKNNYKKVFVIISDAFRYEIGQELYTKVRPDATIGGECSVEYLLSPLPSETRFGMASLLPHKSLQYEKGAVMVDGQPTNGIPARNAILAAKNSSYAAIGFETINNMTRDELRAYMADKSLVYIYHDVIDNAGEHNEGKVFDVVNDCIEEIMSLIRKLYGHLQISNFYVTADHGFLYRRKPIEESQKYSNIVSLQPTEAAKRYVITDNQDLSIPYTVEMPMDEVDNGSYRIIAPYGYDIFKTQGAGLQYVHGGTSLQEVIVPVVHISKLRSNETKEGNHPVGVRLKTITRKITNRSFTLEFEQYEKVEDKRIPITCETFFEDEFGTAVSNPQKFTAASKSDDPAERVTKVRFALLNMEFDRSKRYYLILRNVEKPDEYIAKEQFVIDILGFKLF